MNQSLGSANTSATSMPDFSIVIPVFNGGQALEELYHRLVAVVRTLSSRFEILFIEDCGEDDSWDVIRAIAEKDSRVHGIQLSRNFGQHAATLCGFAHARGQWVATLDDDLEQAPEQLPELFAKAQEGYDLVYGVLPKRSHSNWRNVSSNLARFAFGKAIPALNSDYTSYRLLSGSLARELSRFDSPYPFVDGYLSWLVNRYATVEIPHHPRPHGSSGYTLKKLLAHTSNIFVTFSILPLRIASVAGLLFSVFGFVWLASILLGNLFNWITVSGFTSIMAAIIMFGGIQLLILGIIGEYLGRMSTRSFRKPLYLVAESTSGERHE